MKFVLKRTFGLKIHGDNDLWGREGRGTPAADLA